MSFKSDGKYLMVNAVEKGWSAEGCKEQRYWQARLMICAAAFFINLLSVKHAKDYYFSVLFTV